MGYTVAEHIKITEDPDTLITKGIANIFQMGSPILEILPIATIGMLEAKGLKTDTLPTIGNRQLNGTYSAQSIGTVAPISEMLGIVGGPVNIDRVFLKTKGLLVDPVQFQLEGKADAISYDFNDNFINNDPVTNKDMFTGIKKRIQEGSGSVNEYTSGGQLIAARDPAAATEGLAPKSDEASAEQFFDYVNALLRKLPKNRRAGTKAMFMNEDGLDLFTSLARRRKLLNTAKDQYDREIETYRGCRLYDIGEKADQTTGIILNTETGGSAGGSTDCTSIYACMMGDEYLQGVQLEPLETREVGEVPSEAGTVFIQWMLEWVVGLFMTNPRSIARLSGIRIL
jgi:hypothetical protein